MSHATENPIACHRTDLGCTASIPGSKHHQMRAQRAGWFFSYQEGTAYCPLHVPEWVEEWRARQKERRGVLAR